jgi:translocation and assembly module TamB
VTRLAVARLEIDQLPPLLDLQAQLALGAERGQQHRLTLQHLATDRLSLQGQARIGTHGAMAVDARLQARSLAGSGAWMPWQASLQLQGPLLDMQAQGGWTASPATPRAPPPCRTEDPAQALRRLAAGCAHPHHPGPGPGQPEQPGAPHPAGCRHRRPQRRAGPSGRGHAGHPQPDPGRWDQGLLPLRSASLALAGTPSR